MLSSNETPLVNIFWRGLRFDLAALTYVNSLYILLTILPIPGRSTSGYQKTIQALFIVSNSIAVAANLADTVYFPFAQCRSTFALLSQFKGNDNIPIIVLTAMWQYWHITLIWIVSIAALWGLYRQPKPTQKINGWPQRVREWSIITVMLLCCTGCIRGGFHGHRPLGIIDAQRFTLNAYEQAAILNTPFTLIRKAMEKALPHYTFFSPKEAEALYNPEHPNRDHIAAGEGKNVVCIIIEGFTKENSAYLSRHLLPGEYKGFTPFIDSLCREGLTWQNSFANGIISIDALPALMLGLPRIDEAHLANSSVMQKEIHGYPLLLQSMGYSTAFFHGATTGSMGFYSITPICGLTHYYGRNEYEAAYPERDDYDGTWGIYDDRFLDYTLHVIDTMQRPFHSVIFTLSSHHPWNLPKDYNDPLGPDVTPHQRAIRYVDYALEQFFKKAQGMEWFKNTLFIITADHSTMQHWKEFQNAIGCFDIPILLYDPSNPQLKGYDTTSIAQQIDIYPTVLSYLGYKKPFIAFGQDLLNSSPEKSFAFSYYNGCYQLLHQGKILLHNGEKSMGLYDFIHDRELTHNLLNTVECTKHEELMKAFLQQITSRVWDNRLVVGKE